MLHNIHGKEIANYILFYKLNMGGILEVNKEENINFIVFVFNNVSFDLKTY